jgi:hypothetical protein
MPEADYFGTAQAAAVVDARVGIAVNKNDIARPGQARYCRKIGLIPRREYDAGPVLIKLGKLALEGTMTTVTAIGHARAGCTRTFTVNRFLRCIPALLREGKSQIIICSQKQYPVIPDPGFGRGINFFYGRSKNLNALRQQGFSRCRHGVQLI